MKSSTAGCTSGRNSETPAGCAAGCLLRAPIVNAATIGNICFKIESLMPVPGEAFAATCRLFADRSS
jgi:hypothetical protein